MYSVLPNVQKASYVGGDLITFEINSDPSLAVLPNSIKISGTLTVGTNAVPPARLANPAAVYMNPTIGCHALIDQVSTETTMQGVLENINDYGRAVVTIRQAMSGQLESTSDSTKALELCLPDGYSYFPVFYGQAAGTFTNDICLTPMICINSSVQAIPFARTGSLKINFTLAQSSRALHGADAGTSSYVLSNLQLTYLTVPATKEMLDTPVILGKMETIRRQLSTATTSFQTNASLAATSVLGSFILQADLAGTTFDHFRTLNINIGQLGFTYNDGNSLVSYQLDSQEEIMMNYLFAVNGNTAISPFKSSLALVQGLDSISTSVAQGGYGVGARFEPAIDMTKSQLGVMINNAVMAGPVIGYFIFRGGMVV